MKKALALLLIGLYLSTLTACVGGKMVTKTTELGGKITETAASASISNEQEVTKRSIAYYKALQVIGTQPTEKTKPVVTMVEWNGQKVPFISVETTKYATVRIQDIEKPAAWQSSRGWDFGISVVENLRKGIIWYTGITEGASLLRSIFNGAGDTYTAGNDVTLNNSQNAASDHSSLSIDGGIDNSEDSCTDCGGESDPLTDYLGIAGCSSQESYEQCRCAEKPISCL